MWGSVFKSSADIGKVAFSKEDIDGKLTTIGATVASFSGTSVTVHVDGTI